jgi:long-chain acyl-CoA synthetase
MGCGTSRDLLYSKYEKIDDNLSGPFINPNLIKFEDVEKELKDKSWIIEFMKIYPNYMNKPCLGYRRSKDNKSEFEQKFTWLTYREVWTMSENVCRRLELLKLVPTIDITEEKQRYKFLGFFSRNCIEYVVTDLACQMNGITTIPLNPNLSTDAIEHIINQSEISTVCITQDAKIIDVLAKLKNKCIKLRNIVLYDYNDGKNEFFIKRLHDCGFDVAVFTELTKSGDNLKEVKLEISKSDNVCTICYTPGASGVSKGVKLTQKNIFAQMCSINSIDLDFKDEVMLCYLPLSHIIEKVNYMNVIYRGGRIGLISGDVKDTLMDDLVNLKPTYLIAVPKILRMIRHNIIEKIYEGAEGCGKSAAVNGIIKKRLNFKESGKITHSWYDLVAFKHVRDSFGGNLKAIISCSAPLAKDVCIDIKILFSIPVVEAYELTECTGMCVITSANDLSNKSSGGCVRASKFKLVDIPELRFDSKTLLDGECSPTGEICVYGPLVFSGYFKNETATKEVLKDGWFYTGDIGRIMPFDRGLKIIDRKKKIFKLAQGEYIIPAKLEVAYSRSKYVKHICITGDSDKDFIIAVVHPNMDIVEKWARGQGKVKEGAPFSKEVIHALVTKDDDLRALIKNDLLDIAVEDVFSNSEKVAHVILSKLDFTVENHMMTHSLKLCRHKIRDHFKSEINMLYRRFSTPKS